MNALSIWTACVRCLYIFDFTCLLVVFEFFQPAMAAKFGAIICCHLRITGLNFEWFYSAQCWKWVNSSSLPYKTFYNIFFGAQSPERVSTVMGNFAFPKLLSFISCRNARYSPASVVHNTLHFSCLFWLEATHYLWSWALYVSCEHLNCFKNFNTVCCSLLLLVLHASTT